MRQQVKVESLVGDRAVVSLRRESACSGDCHKCSGCGAVSQSIQVTADNLIGARPGERVWIESSSATVLLGACTVYVLPLVGFLAGYFLGSIWDRIALCALGGFLLGWIPAFLLNKHLKHRPPNYRIVAYAEEQSGG